VLLCEGREIAGPGPERAVVFQNHSLLPWMTCFENVMLGVEQVFGRKEGKLKLKARVERRWNGAHGPRQRQVQTGRGRQRHGRHAAPWKSC
jgi:nitrate/nitrite transport system ATP-binding protein